MKTQAATSSTRSKKIWLLWLAPLLVLVMVPVIMMVLRQRQTITMNDADLPIELRKNELRKNDINPFIKLDYGLKRHRFVGNFEVSFGEVVPDYYRYSRKDQSLLLTTNGSQGAVYHQWRNVSPSAIEDAAKRSDSEEGFKVLRNHGAYLEKKWRQKLAGISDS